MKNNFSSSIGESLAGRIENENPPAIPKPEKISHLKHEATSSLEKSEAIPSPEVDQKGRQDKGLGKNIDGSFKQSNAGRRTIAKAKKKVQLPLTIKPDTKDALDEWAATKSRSAANYVSEYVEEHLNEIMDYFNK